MRQILVIFGTRPEAIKMAPIVRELNVSSSLKPVICVTAQHREMLDQVLDFFDIKPDFDLDLMRPGQSLAGLTSRAIEGLTDVIDRVSPDAVLCQGDTTTAMAAALAAFYARIPIGHVEAGLRTHQLYDPFPEEVNRQLISVMATYNFVPTATAKDALLAEGRSEDSIYLTGNTVIDALIWTVAQDIPLPVEIPLASNEKLILVTAHRRESFGARFESICEAIKEIALSFPQTRIVYPVHLNPHVQEPVKRILANLKRVHLIEPLPYPQFAQLMNKAHFILTDSGGLQEEAPALGKPVLVMRETTERPEAVEAGVAKLVGTDRNSIVTAARCLLEDEKAYQAMATAVSPFGDGHAAGKIVKILEEKL